MATPSDDDRATFERLPTEMIQRITTLACTDGGRTGCSLALVSHRIAAASASARLHSAYVAGKKNIEQLHDLVTRSSPEKARVRHLFVDKVEYVDALEILTRAVSSTLETLVWTLVGKLDWTVLHRLALTSMPVLRTLILRLRDCQLRHQQVLETDAVPHEPALPRLTKALVLLPTIDIISKAADILFIEAPLLQRIVIPEVPTITAVAMQPAMTGRSPKSIYNNRPWATRTLFLLARVVLLADYSRSWRPPSSVDSSIRYVVEAVGPADLGDASEMDPSIACADLGIFYRSHQRSPEEWKDEWMDEVEHLTLKLFAS